MYNGVGFLSSSISGFASGQEARPIRVVVAAMLRLGRPSLKTEAVW